MEHNERIGELCRNGRTIYYAVVGRVMIENTDRAAIVRTLNQNAAKLHEWDKLRLE